MNKSGESTLSILEEDQLLEITNDGGLKNMFETTSNLQTFWTGVRVEYPEIATKSTETSASISNILSLCSRVFCNDSKQKVITE